MEDEKDLKELHELAKKGEEEALTKILEMFRPLLYENSIIDGKFNEECFQELSMKLIECVKKFEFRNQEDLALHLNKIKDSE